LCFRAPPAHRAAKAKHYGIKAKHYGIKARHYGIDAESIEVAPPAGFPARALNRGTKKVSVHIAKGAERPLEPNSEGIIIVI